MANAPLGWGDRHNQMSEHDIKLGGMTAKNAYKNDTAAAGGGGGGDIGYKSSDQVRDFYLNDFQRDDSGIISSRGASSSSTLEKLINKEGSDVTTASNNGPDFWEERQKEGELQNKQMGVFSQSSTSNSAAVQHRNGNGDDDGSLSAEVALVQIATHTLERMAKSLEVEGSKSKIPMAERAAFAKAMKEGMDALAKQA